MLNRAFPIPLKDYMTPEDSIKLTQIANATLHPKSSEEDVRSKIVIELFRLLGYPDDLLATEFPVYGHEGRTKVHHKSADVVYFNDQDYAKHVSESERQWVQEHALVVVEVKKPTEKIDSFGQAEFYAVWLHAPYVVTTNGNELIIRHSNGFSSYKKLLHIQRKELNQKWGELQKILHLPIVSGYKDSQLKAGHAGKIDYNPYLVNCYAELKYMLQCSISRFLEGKTKVFPFQRMLFEEKTAQSLISIKEVLSSEAAVILGEPGSGKTYLLKDIAKHILESNSSDTITWIPVIIEAKYWGSCFNTISGAIHSQLSPFISGLTEDIINSELKSNKFVILIDGFDEIRNAKDIFQLEVQQFVSGHKAQVILTSRKANYHNEFAAYFSEWTITGLNDDQIDKFAEDTTSILNFSYRLLKLHLLELARLPLYLDMLCQLIRDVSTQIPNNKAKIQEKFARYLLDSYPFKRNPSYNPSYTLNDKLKFLSLLGKRKSENIDFSDYNQCTRELGISGDPRLLLSEVLESGILQGNLSSFDFLHPTIREFFYARSIAYSPNDIIMEFVERKHESDDYFEIILFVVGLLRDLGQQAPILDYLEENNLILYLNCLNARNHIDLSTSIDYPEVESQYLSQLQHSYNKLLDIYFNKIKSKFSPFCFINKDILTALNGYKVQVKGSLDISGSQVRYEYVPDGILPDLPPSLPSYVSFKVPLDNNKRTHIVSSSDGRHFYKNLNLTRLGLDSAREVAVNDISERLEKLITKQLLNEPIQLICEELISQIHRVASNACKHDDQSLKHIWDYKTGIYEAQDYLPAFEKLQDNPFISAKTPSSTRLLPINLESLTPHLLGN